MAKKDVERDEQDANHAEPRVYELSFHIDPELGTEEAKKAYQGLRAKAEAAGSLVAEGEPQKIQLAYTVSRKETGGRRDFDSSYFAWVAYEANGEGHDAVVEAAKAEGRVFRYLDIRTEKEAARHAAEMHEIMAKESLKEEQEEEVADAEIEQALKEVA